jgi:hypothetical protein
MAVVADLTSPSSSEFRVPPPIYHGRGRITCVALMTKRSKKGTQAALYRVYENMGNQLIWGIRWGARVIESGGLENHFSHSSKPYKIEEILLPARAWADSELLLISLVFIRFGRSLVTK